MKISLAALRQFVDTGDLSEIEIAETFAHLGFPHDGIEHFGANIKEVVVGEILEMAPHPEADRLSLLKVATGGEPLSIVCGAKNMKQGDFVALAPVGSQIPGPDGQGFKLKKSKIRGEVSEGMCCSFEELGLAEESEGIWVLNQNADPSLLKKNLGKPVVEVMGLEDSIFDLDVTPNRGDALSVKGLSRELAAKLKTKLKVQKRLRWKNNSKIIQPSIESFEDTFAFAATLVKGVQYKATPFEWRLFLEKQGARSISNLVDVTNIVLFEQGHPIHFFDADKIDIASICARRARAGEKLQLLDGSEVELSPEDIVIADKEGPLSLAGVMGGVASSVTETTKNIVVEMASFDPKRIRATAQRHQISSESSYRFERGVAPSRIDETMERVLALLEELSGFESAEGSKAAEKDRERKSCLWNRAKVEAKLGRLQLEDDAIFDRLRALEYEFDNRGGALQIIFPWYRFDCEVLEDVMEDVARLVGYEELETTPLVVAESVSLQSKLRDQLQATNALVDQFCQMGFSEIVLPSFSNPEIEKKFGFRAQSSVEIANPINAERSVMRQSLLPGLVERAIRNAETFEDQIAFVEVGPVFQLEGPSIYDQSAFSESYRIGCVMLVRAQDEKKLWSRKVDAFFDFKGRLSAVLQNWESSEEGELYSDNTRVSLYHPNRIINFKNGYAGEAHPVLKKSLDISQRLFFAEWDLSWQPKRRLYQVPSEFPPIDLDLSLEVDLKISAAQIQEGLLSKAPAILKHCEIYDVFESDDLAKKKKRALTFQLRYQAGNRTLSMEEAKKAQEKAVKNLTGSFSEEVISLR